jgi:outer membrane protein OmpA-like peptidoglycan-associated protein
VAAGLFAALPAAAQDLDLRPVENKVLAGQGRPALVVEASRAVKLVELTLTACDGKQRVVRIPALGAGQSKRFPLDAGPGRCDWKAEFTYAGADETWALEFPVVIAKPMEIRISRDTVDLAEGRIAFSANSAVAKVQVLVLGEGGRTIAEREFPQGTPAGGVAEVRFTPPAEAVTLIRLTAWDPDGFYGGVEIAPWFVEVPGDQVGFEFGKADVLPAEEPKLADTLAKVRTALGKQGNEFKARLYVAGYTDTVGGRDYNQELSDRRAAAIAHWMRAHGLEIGVCSQGMGEDGLAVPTPDETPEPRNRRTLYVLANQPPPASKVFPRSNWKCL